MMIENLKADLKQHLASFGYSIIPKSKLPISQDQWDQIEQLSDENVHNFEHVKNGDSGDSHNVYVRRLIKEGEPLSEKKETVSLLFSDKIKKLLSEVTSINFPTISRCQAHILKKGGFIGEHVDKDFCKEYEYAVVFMLSDDYQGGEFNITLDRGERIVLKPEKYSLLVTCCHLPHYVSKVTNGERKTIVYFLRSIA